MFGEFLLNEGLELEIRQELKEVLGKLDSECRAFSCDGIGYQLAPLRGTLGAEWRVLVKAVDRERQQVLGVPVGFIVVRKQDDGTLSFLVPPRSEWSTPQAQQFDPEGKYFASFILHVLGVFQKLGYVELPGPLPVA